MAPPLGDSTPPHTPNACTCRAVWVVWLRRRSIRHCVGVVSCVCLPFWHTSAFGRDRFQEITGTDLLWQGPCPRSISLALVSPAHTPHGGFPPCLSRDRLATSPPSLRIPLPDETFPSGENHHLPTHPCCDSTHTRLVRSHTHKLSVHALLYMHMIKLKSSPSTARYSTTQPPPWIFLSSHLARSLGQKWWLESPMSWCTLWCCSVWSTTTPAWPRTQRSVSWE